MPGSFILFTPSEQEGIQAKAEMFGVALVARRGARSADGTEFPNVIRFAVEEETKGPSMKLPHWEGWHLIGAYPDHEPDDVGSWILHHGGEALLLEVPEGLPVADVQAALEALGSPLLRYVTASHEHEDHLDTDAWAALQAAFADAQFLHPAFISGDKLLHLAGEPLYLVKAPKHSRCDVVTVFRGVAMTGDIETGMLESVTNEVPMRIRRLSMRWLAEFPERTGYHVHTTVSAHLNSVRIGVDWPALFTIRDKK